MSSDCTNIVNFPSSFLQVSNLVLNLLRWRQCYQSSHVNSPSIWCWDFLLNIWSMTFQCVTLASSLSHSSWCRCRHTWRWRLFGLRFNFCESCATFLVIFQWYAWKIRNTHYRSSSPFAQWWTVIHNPRRIKIHVRHSGGCNDGTQRWFWIRSCNFSLVTIANHFVDNCTNSVFSVSRDVTHTFVHTWDCSCQHSRWCTRTFRMWRMSINAIKWTFLTYFLCLLHDLRSFLFHCCHCI